MKRFGRIEIITAVMAIVTSLASPVPAAISWSGDVIPSDPSTWNSSTEGYIGHTGHGTMGITDGSAVSSGYGFIGVWSGSTGEVTVDGKDSMWTNSGNIIVGYKGSGTLSITNGGKVSNSTGYIGQYANSTGAVAVNGTGSKWTNSQQIKVGCSLSITGGGEVVSNGGIVGSLSGVTGEVTVDGDGSTWTNSDDLFVGYFANGTMNIINGGKVSSQGENTIGWASDLTGVVTVSGVGSTWTANNYRLRVGSLGEGTLNITNGGEVRCDGSSIGRFAGSAGEVTVDGYGSKLTSDYGIYIGYEGNGTLNITDGGLVSVAGTVTIDVNGGDDSFINMDTGGKLALLGDGGDSLVAFLGLIDGTDAIRYWNSSIAGWADITGATYGIDYTLEYLTEGDLAGYTMLTVPEPATMLLFGLGGLLLRKRK
ncbi:MAG: PEP-CTERM sorting domain-containing protein [Sedimentisphaerales bacterium]|nr:PEP-CTERM sorting domain-containing protein [Sedimentisphaerales bacterium]